jgi:ornithine cyclodeaminase
LSEVRVWSPNAEHRQAFVRHASETTALAVRSVATAAEAIRGADLIVLATSSRTPVILDADVEPGAHITAVGACRPDQREMPTPLIARARVFVDSRLAAQQEAGDILIPIGEGAVGADHVAGELGQVVGGHVSGRQDDVQVTVFKSLGLAVEDMVAAHLALSRARAAGLGQPFSC